MKRNNNESSGPSKLKWNKSVKHLKVFEKLEMNPNDSNPNAPNDNASNDNVLNDNALDANAPNDNEPNARNDNEPNDNQPNASNDNQLDLMDVNASVVPDCTQPDELVDIVSDNNDVIALYLT